MAKTKRKRGKRTSDGTAARNYRHPDAESPMRPDVGTQAQFQKKKEPQTYRYDSSLSPTLDWDGQNPAREEGEAAIREILDAKTLESAKAAAAKLKALGKPFLNWAGKTEHLSFDVPTLPLFVHERLATQAILETIKGHKSDKQLDFVDDLFGDPRHSITDQVLKAYEHKDKWVNRMILGDSLVVMNSLLHYEGLGEQVQMIYMDPPYGVKFGSNFQPFIRNRDVGHGDDNDMTREPEMVQAYRDTWELGLHSYLSYMRDRLRLSWDLLKPEGSIFVQIGDAHVHHVRELLDEVFGPECFQGLLPFKKTGGQSSASLPAVVDYILWYSRNPKGFKYRQLFLEKVPGQEGATNYTWIEEKEGTRRPLTADEKRTWKLPADCRVFQPYPLFSEGPSAEDRPFKWRGKEYKPSPNAHWKTTETGLKKLAKLNRLLAQGNTLRFVNYLSDYPVTPLTNVWMDTQISGFGEDRLYVVQTLPKVIQRCILMTTDPGDLVLDPTCGGGTTAKVAEHWGRRWITIDTSRVPLALTRQRLLTSTFPYFKLTDGARGPAGGFVYERKQNRKGAEIGGIVPHITLTSVAHDEKADEEVLVDRPVEDSGVVRVSGPFTVEATIPTPMNPEDSNESNRSESPPESYGTFVDRMLEVLRQSPILRLSGNKSVKLTRLRRPAKTLSLSAEAVVPNGKDQLVALVFGPENGAISEKLVYEAAREAHAKNYLHLYVIGFAIQPNARALIEKCDKVIGVPALYIQATPDLMMGDLLKNMRSSQIFSVCGLPEVKITKKKIGKETKYQVELLGYDVFDPSTMKVDHRKGDDVPAWFLDIDHNDLCFHVNQAFFPRTGAWENLKRALKTEYEASVWKHLSGATSAPFEPGEYKHIAVKVIDDRGNELLVTKSLKGVR
ncbi:MAG: site-specific DNA-methyltransferase [Elusimicrobiota bacterium]